MLYKKNSIIQFITDSSLVERRAPWPQPTDQWRSSPAAPENTITIIVINLDMDISHLLGSDPLVELRYQALRVVEDGDLEAWEDVQDQAAGRHVEAEAGLVEAGPGKVIVSHVESEHVSHQTLFLEVGLQDEAELAVRVHPARMSLLEGIWKQKV